MLVHHAGAHWTPQGGDKDVAPDDARRATVNWSSGKNSIAREKKHWARYLEGHLRYEMNRRQAACHSFWMMQEWIHRNSGIDNMVQRPASESAGTIWNQRDSVTCLV